MSYPTLPFTCTFNSIHMQFSYSQNPLKCLLLRRNEIINYRCQLMRPQKMNDSIPTSEHEMLRIRQSTVWLPHGKIHSLTKC